MLREKIKDVTHFSLLENGRPLRNAQWIGPSVFSYSCCRAFSKFSGTVVKNYMICIVCSVAQNTSRNTKRIGPSKSSGRQSGTRNRPSVSKSIQFIRRGSVFFAFLQPTCGPEASAILQDQFLMVGLIRGTLQVTFSVIPIRPACG